VVGGEDEKELTTMFTLSRVGWRFFRLQDLSGKIRPDLDNGTEKQNGIRGLRTHRGRNSLVCLFFVSSAQCRVPFKQYKKRLKKA